MRKIVFNSPKTRFKTGQLQNIEFASRYNREVAPKLVIEGKQLGKFLAKNKNLNATDLKDVKDTISDLRSAGEANKLLKSFVIRQNENWSKGYNKKFNVEQSNGLVPKEYRKERIQQLKDAAKKRKPIVPTTNTTSIPSETKTVSSSSSITKSPLLKDVTKNKKLPIKKSALIGAGLLTAGAVGYGLYRKTRKDKGRKRGNYRK